MLYLLRDLSQPKERAVLSIHEYPRLELYIILVVISIHLINFNISTNKFLNIYTNSRYLKGINEGDK